MLAMLSEELMTIKDLQMIQVNTDGVTVRIKKSSKDRLMDVCKWWEMTTKLELEFNNYSRMFIRDVNNYIAEYEKGGVKRKGVYEYKLGMHQNHSGLVVKKAAEAFLLHGKPINTFITEHEDMMDFMLRTKTPKTSCLMWGEKEMQNTTRYYISNGGEQLMKIMPPLARKPGIERVISVNKGFNTRVCNNMKTAYPLDINYQWYINETIKLEKGKSNGR